MTTRVFHPQTSEYTGNDVGIVIFNSIGATVDHDTGWLAQSVADILMAPTIAAERPYSHGVIPHPSKADDISNWRGFIKEMMGMAKEIDHVADEEHVRGIIVAGHSAAGQAALAATCTEGISAQQAVVGLDPMNMRPMGSVKEGKAAYAEYIRAMRKEQKDCRQRGESLVIPHNPLPIWRQPPRLLSIARNQLYDTYHYQRLWASLGTVVMAQEIAVNLSAIEMSLLFATNSMAVAPENYPRYQDFITSRRTSGKPVFFERTEERTNHASFDHHPYFAQCLRPTLERVVEYVKG